MVQFYLLLVKLLIPSGHWKSISHGEYFDLDKSPSEAELCMIVSLGIC